MRVVLLLVLALFLHPAQGHAAPLNRAGFVLTFQSDFTKPLTGAAGEQWKTCYYFGGGCADWHSRALPGENELYVDQAFCGLSPFSILGTALVITAQAPTAAQIAAMPPACKVGMTTTRTFTSGIITTQASFSQTYGYFEMSAVMPQGQGDWPAFWLLPTADTGANLGRLPEIDVVEEYEGQRPTTSAGKPYLLDSSYIPIATVHPLGGAAAVSDVNLVKALTPKAAHLFGVLWLPHKLIFYTDNQQTFEADVTISDPHYVVANLAKIASYPNLTKGQEIINYIRAYKAPAALLAAN